MKGRDKHKGMLFSLLRPQVLTQLYLNYLSFHIHKFTQSQVMKQQQGRSDEKLQQTMTLTVKRLDVYMQVSFQHVINTCAYTRNSLS